MGRAKEISMPTPSKGRGVFSDSSEVVSNVSISRIDPNPWQPRIHFDEGGLAELADSIDKHGLIEPIIVRKVGDRFELVAGERRLRAHQLLNKETIKSVVREMSDETSEIAALVENIERSDLDPIEVGLHVKRIMQKRGITAKDVAELLRKSEATISRYIGAASICDDAINQAHAAGYKNIKVLTAIAKLPATAQAEALTRIIGEEMTTVSALAFVAGIGKGGVKPEVSTLVNSSHAKVRKTGNKMSLELLDDRLNDEQKKALDHFIKLLQA